MAEFTKEELLEIIRIQQKTATQLETIASSLASVTERLQEMARTVAIITDCRLKLMGIEENVKVVVKDVNWLRTLIGIITIVVLVVATIIKVIGL